MNDNIDYEDEFDDEFDDECDVTNYYSYDEQLRDEWDNRTVDKLAELSDGYATLTDISAVKHVLRKSRKPLVEALKKVGVLTDYLSEQCLKLIRELLQEHGYVRCDKTGKWSHPIRRRRRRKPGDSQ